MAFTKLSDDFYLITSPSLTHPWDANGYLYLGDEPVLIDCGSMQGFSNLLKNLKELNLKIKDIKHILATHCHFDHLSAAAQIKEKADALLYIHKQEKDAVEMGDQELTCSWLYGQIFPETSVDYSFNDYESFDFAPIKAYHTPGHSPGSVCYILSLKCQNILICGDTLWGGFHSRIKSNIDDWHDSLAKIQTLDFDTMTFGHGPDYLVQNAREKVSEAQKQLGVFYNPWFKPFYEKFKY